MQCHKRGRQYGSDYSLFKQDLLCKARYLPIDVITAVVGEYKTVIDSKRRSSCITTFHDLISVLEKRCCVSPEDYSQLQNIVNRLPEEDKRTMLARLNHRRTVVYEDDYSNNGPQNPPTHSPVQNFSVNNDTLPPEVLDRVSSEIGNKWRELGRKLELREGDLNNIQSEHKNDYTKCAYQLLMLYQSRCAKSNLRRNLLQALESARRRDLKQDIENMFQEMN